MRHTYWMTTCLTSEVIAKAINREVESGTDAVAISCKVAGLTVALKTVKWTTSDGIDVKTLPGHTVTDGTLEDDNSQTTTLTFASSRTNTDVTYTCVIEPSYPDVSNAISRRVGLGVYSKFFSFIDFQIRPRTYGERKLR